MTHAAEFPAPTPAPILKSRHILSIAPLSREEIVAILDLADRYVELNRQIARSSRCCRGRTQINLFFEASTRTQSSFELAGKRLGADVMNMAIGSSSVSKGETVLDTAMTLNAMHPDLLIVRHHASGAVELLAQKVSCAVINAGDGQHEHPTQALLDALTIRRRLKRIEGLIVAICGDVAPFPRGALQHSAVPTSSAPRCALIAPSTLLPAGVERLRRRDLPRHARGPGGRRRGDDAAPAARAHERRLRPIASANIIASSALTRKSSSSPSRARW